MTLSSEFVSLLENSYVINLPTVMMLKRELDGIEQTRTFKAFFIFDIDVIFYGSPTLATINIYSQDVKSRLSSLFLILSDSST